MNSNALDNPANFELSLIETGFTPLRDINEPYSHFSPTDAFPYIFK